MSEEDEITSVHAALSDSIGQQQGFPAFLDTLLSLQRQNRWRHLVGSDFHADSCIKMNDDICYTDLFEFAYAKYFLAFSLRSVAAPVSSPKEDSSTPSRHIRNTAAAGRCHDEERGLSEAQNSRERAVLGCSGT